MMTLGGHASLAIVQFCNLVIHMWTFLDVHAPGRHMPRGYISHIHGLRYQIGWLFSHISGGA